MPTPRAPNQLEAIRQAGKQWLRREANGLLMLKLTGEVTVEEAQGIAAAFVDWVKPTQRLFLLIDLRDLGSFPGDARAALAAWDRKQRPSTIASFGASLQLSGLSNQVLTGMRVLGKHTTGTFVRDEAEAREWLLRKMAEAARR